MSGSTSGGSGAGGMVFKEKVTRAPMNREPLWSNKYIKRYDVSLNVPSTTNLEGSGGCYCC